MSIIHNALKKTQQNLSDLTQKRPKPHKDSCPAKNETGNPSSKPEQTPDQQANKTTAFFKSNANIILLLVAMLLVFLGVYLTLFLADSSQQSVTKPAPLQNESAVVKTQEAPEVSTPVIQTDPNPVLSGIMTMGDKKVAIIDGEVYALGETVKGMTIIEISLEKVQLQNNGQVKTLTIRRK